MTALLERERTGRGQHIEISMVRTLLTLNSIAVTGKQIPSTREYLTAPVGYGIYPTKDGYIVLGVNSDKLWRKLCESMGRPELATDPRYATYAERDSRTEEANPTIRGRRPQPTTQQRAATV